MPSPLSLVLPATSQPLPELVLHLMPNSSDPSQGPRLGAEQGDPGHWGLMQQVAATYAEELCEVESLGSLLLFWKTESHLRLAICPSHSSPSESGLCKEALRWPVTQATSAGQPCHLPSWPPRGPRQALFGQEDAHSPAPASCCLLTVVTAACKPGTSFSLEPHLGDELPQGIARCPCYPH